MSNKTEYKDILAFHPGEYVKDVIADYTMSQEEFAKRLGTTPKTISKLVNGEANLSGDLALKLSKLTGTSTELWLNLQKKYDQKKLEIQQLQQLEEERRIFEFIDYKYFVDHFHLPAYKRDIPSQIKALQNKLFIASLERLTEKDLLVCLRNPSGALDEKSRVNSNILLALALEVAKKKRGPKYTEKKLMQLLPNLRSLTLEPFETFFPKLEEELHQCGVSFVFLPYLKNSAINGAVKKIPNNRVLLLLTDKYKTTDVFWFTLFHELGHIIEKDFEITLSVNKNNLSEEYADNFAIHQLLDPLAFQEFAENTHLNEESILAFSKDQGIHPGIVLGRLQRKKFLAYEKYPHLKDKIPH